MSDSTALSEIQNLTDPTAPSPFHPDIEPGLNRIFQSGIDEAVGSGSGAEGLRSELRLLAQGIEMSAQGSDTYIQLTSDAVEVLKNRVADAIQKKLNTGLATCVQNTELSTRQGELNHLEAGQNMLEQIIILSKEYNVPLSYTEPQHNTFEEKSSNPRVIAGPDALRKYLHDVITSNLPAGLDSQITDIGERVADANVDWIPNRISRVDTWLTMMAERGYRVVDEPLPPLHIRGSERSVAVRAVSRAEATQRIDDAIRTNFIRGIRKIIEKVQYETRHGASNPLSLAEKRLNFYIKEGERLRLVNLDLKEAFSDKQFNTKLVYKEIITAVQNNLAEGVKEIVLQHLDFASTGFISTVKVCERDLEHYLLLAEDVGISLDAEGLRNELKSHITEKILSKGVRTLIEQWRKILQQGKFFYKNTYMRYLDELQSFLQERALGGNLEAYVKAFRTYLEQTGATPKLLTSETNRGSPLTDG